MLVRDPLVAEVLADLVDALEPADDQPLEVELGRDPEVEVLLEVVPVGDERLREGAAVARLQHRRLDLDEAVRVEVAPDRGDDAAAGEEVGARLLVHQQVEVALAVALLDVGEAVEGVRQRRAVLRQQLELDHLQRRLAAARLGGVAGDADDVAEVDVDLAGEQLDPPAAVDEVEEGDLPHLAPREHASREPERLRLVGRARARHLVGAAVDGDDSPGREALRQHRRGESRAIRPRPRRTSASGASVAGRPAYAALMSRILYFSDPRGAATSTVSPFFLPMIALPTGDSFESLTRRDSPRPSRR